MCNLIWNSELRFYLGLSRFLLNQNKFSWSFAKMLTFSIKLAKDFIYQRGFKPVSRGGPIVGLVKELSVIIIMTWLWLLSFGNGFSSATCSFHPIYFSLLSHFLPYISPQMPNILLYIFQGHTGTEVFLQTYLEDKLKQTFCPH